ncbi:hypothetical protein [Bacillus toyonensis]|uniref:hypothetical protein n=1 Tax=Bacillus toyonensis TaxID=155322 RepID=UPI002E1E671C|nr:hypothetical protein [Bacillus toyonensis]
MLHLIRQREKELEHFKVQSFYEIHGHFNTNGIPYVGKLLQDHNMMKLHSKEEAQEKLQQLQEHTEGDSGTKIETSAEII